MKGSIATNHPFGGTPMSVFCIPCSIVVYDYWMGTLLYRWDSLLAISIIISLNYHQEQFGGASSSTIFKVYRGQGMVVTEFEKLQQTKGGLLSFNNFLSTSKKRAVSMDFAQRGSNNSDMVGILFVMTVDPAQSTTPFASINDVSYFGEEEDEVLFAMHSIFRIRDIRPMGGNGRLFRVELTLTSDNDKDLHVLTDRIREESFPEGGKWERLGVVLRKMGQPQKAQQVYEMLLEQETEERRKAPIYHQLGSMKDDQGEYQEAIVFYEKCLEIYKRTLAPNDPDLANSYNNIGAVYANMGEDPKALSYFEKALAIRQQSLPSNHPSLAMSYNNIGNVYDNMGEYPKALSSHEKALAIQQQSLPSNHPELAMSYNNIGLVYANMGDYPKAFSSHEKALAIRQQSLPSNHPELAASYNNIGMVYANMGEYQKALSSYEKALAIKQQSLPSNHPDLAMSFGHIGNIYFTIGQYSKALPLCQRAVQIAEQSLPPNHPHLQWYKNNLDRVKNKL